MRIITVEEHFEHPEVSRQVLQLGAPPSGLPLNELAEFGSIFNDDRDAATVLGGHRLAHMDAVGVDVQVVSHGNGSPSTLGAPESVDLCRRVNNDLAQQISEHPDRFRVSPRFRFTTPTRRPRNCVAVSAIWGSSAR
jgi:uncharacterized protein